MVIYLAGLQGISAELYEAAGLDGANTWQKFRYVTWPQLRSTTFFVTVMLTINCFKVYDIAIMLAGGGDGKLGTSSTVLVYYIYQKAFIEWDLGYSSAIAMVLFANGSDHYIRSSSGDRKNMRMNKKEEHVCIQHQ